MAIKVRAIKKGYYNFLLREPGKPGDVFDIKDEESFSEKWMERVSGAKPQPPQKKDEHKPSGKSAKPATRASDESKI